MKNNGNENIDQIDFLLKKRFEGSRQETIEALDRLRLDKTIDQDLIEQIDQEDLAIWMKFRTYKKCRRQAIISIIIIAICLLFWKILPILLLVTVFAVIVLISSFFGIKANLISHRQMEYFMNK